MKSDPDGFSEYIEKREQGLEELTDESIIITIEKLEIYKTKYLKIRIKDSGEGFDINKDIQELAVNEKLSGRGVKLVKELCINMEYKDKGNDVEVVYQI